MKHLITITTIIFDIAVMKYCIVLLLTIISLPVFSQTSNDTIPLASKTDPIQVSISIDDLNTLKSENDSLKLQLSAITEKYQKLQVESEKDKSRLSQLEIDVNNLKRDTTILYIAQREADKRLVNIASNFLYIPYEAFSIEKIAIPAFKAISSKELRRDHQIKYELLYNYRKDITDLLAFIKYACTELQKPFVKDANEVLVQFRDRSFYLSYHKYPEWTDTYLGSKLSLIEKQLNDFDGNQHKVDFTELEKELNKCLKTIETL